MGVCGSLVIGLLSDVYFRRHLKRLLLACTGLGLAGIAIFTLALPSPVSRSGLFDADWVHLTSIALLSFALGGMFPVAIELAAEIVYPVEESTVAGAITGINCIAGMVYVLLMNRIPNSAVNLPMLASVIFALLLIGLVEERYIRRDADEEVAGEPL